MQNWANDCRCNSHGFVPVYRVMHRAARSQHGVPRSMAAPSSSVGTSSAATAAPQGARASRVLAGMLVMGVVCLLGVSESPQFEVRRVAVSQHLMTVGSTLGDLGEGIAEAESDDVWHDVQRPMPKRTRRREVAEPSVPPMALPSSVEAAKPVDTPKPIETAEPAQVTKPVEVAKPSEVAKPAEASLPAGTLPPAQACAPGCHARGNCNEELGRCDCPPLSEGLSCERGVVPKCRVQWGVSLPFPPCQAWTAEETDWRDFPPSCDCLAECHSLNHRAAYVSWCVNTTRQRILPANEAKRAPNAIADPFGDGKWVRQAYTPGRKDPPLSEARLDELNAALAERLQRDAQASLAGKACSGRGIRTSPMPWKRLPKPQADTPVCHCWPGWHGDACEVGPGDAKMPDYKKFCVHGCSGRGVCKLNWCHCVPGTWGIDCSFGTPRAAAAREVVALAGGSAGAPGGGGWPEAMLTTAAPVLPPMSRTLRIYIYDLPPQFNIWLAAHFRRPGRWDQSYLYSLDTKVHRWLLRSPYRTLDPAEADYFLVPAYLSLGFYDYEFGLYWLTNRGHDFLRGVMRYVRKTWPYFDRRRGADHVLVMTNDKGATFIRGSVPDLAQMTLVTQWGWKRQHIHHPDKDIVVPPMLKVDKLLSETPYLGASSSPPPPPAAAASAASAETPWTYLLSFIGSVRFHTPGYSMGVRQAIYRRYNQTDGFFLRDLRGDSDQGKHKQMGPREYLSVMQRSKFCLAPSGMGFSTRMYESIAQGCVPLIIQDEPVSNTSVDQAFEELLPYPLFSWRLTQADIPNLPALLAAFPADEWRKLRRNLACVWPRVLWLPGDNEAPGIQRDAAAIRSTATDMLGDQSFLREYDAWTSLMTTLARRAARRRNGSATPAPFEWRTPARSCAAAQNTV